MTDRVEAFAHAKVNLFLRVFDREDSGYHGIETAFSLVELADTLLVERTASGVDLTVTGADTGPTEKNLAFRAAGLMLEATGHRFGVRIHLDKQIPVQSGLGGGSSDAAATLHAVNALADSTVPRHEILQFSSRLGSDVPFFTSGTPFAVAWHHGERLFHLPPPPPAPMLLVIPKTGVSTVEAYKALDAAHGMTTKRGAVLLNGEAFRTWGGIGRLGGNDFESVVFAAQPAIRLTFERVAETRPLLARLSGSGSAVFGVYKNAGDCETAAMALGSRDHQLIKTSTRSTAAAAPAVAS